MKKFFLGFAVIFFGLSLVFQNASAGTIGVGVGTGKIDVKEKLKAGGIYTLPTITVYNTGTQEATYTMELTLNERQSELKPNPSWFSFTPSTFKLKPKQTMVVTPTLTLPIDAKEGKYFGYLEAHPDKRAKQGTTAVGVAAAAKLNFEVVYSNVFTATIFKFRSLYIKYAPWTQLATFAVILTIVYRLTRKHLNIQISRNKK